LNAPAVIKVPPGVSVAPELPDLLPEVKPQRGIIGFALRHPTIAVGGALLILIVLMGLLAPYLATVDPTALDPRAAKRL
jgi:peptide/nickel transport system permease protein